MSKQSGKVQAKSWQPPAVQTASFGFSARPFPEIARKEEGKQASQDQLQMKENQPGGMIDNINRSLASASPPAPLPILGLLGVQAKLTLGTVGDVYEQEADRVARQVVDEIHSDPFRASNTTSEGESIANGGEAGRVQRQITVRAAGDAGGEISSEWEGELVRAKGGGQPMSATVREPMERSFGADFGGVRVHTGAQADMLARSIQAKAFTTGQDVFFRQGAYEPGSRGGQELIAHELTHVVQQGGSGVQQASQSVSSSIITRKFVKSDSNLNEYVWKYKNETSGKFRWLMYSIDCGKDIYLDLSKVKELDLSEPNLDLVQNLLKKQAIVKSGISQPLALKTLSLSAQETVVKSLTDNLKKRENTTGNIGKMDFRFEEPRGILYYNSSFPPPVNLTKKDGEKRYQYVKFEPVDNKNLEEIRQQVYETEFPHYIERVNYENYLYVREQSTQTMLSRNVNAVFKWGANNDEKTNDSNSVTENIRKSILKRVSNLKQPQDSYQKVTSALIGKDREEGQDAAMDNINASAYALATGDLNANVTNWEWLHIRGARLGGATQSHNLVSGTLAANSHMIPIEHDVLELSKLASMERPLHVRWRSGGGVQHSHQRQWISIEIETPEGLTNNLDQEILPKGGFARWVFNPGTGATIDRLDRDLQWGVETVKVRQENYHEQAMGVPRNSMLENSMEGMKLSNRYLGFANLWECNATITQTPDSVNLVTKVKYMLPLFNHYGSLFSNNLFDGLLQTEGTMQISSRFGQLTFNGSQEKIFNESLMKVLPMCKKRLRNQFLINEDENEQGSESLDLAQYRTELQKLQFKNVGDSIVTITVPKKKLATLSTKKQLKIESKRRAALKY